MDTDEEERIVAGNRCVNGEKRTDICKNLNRSKGWLSKWVNRYKTGKEDWYKLNIATAHPTAAELEYSD